LPFPKGSTRKLSKEHIEAIRLAHIGKKYTLGRKHTPEEIEKIRNSMRAHYVSEETRRKMSIAQSNRNRKSKIKKVT
jgi:NUMOD3 motif